MTAPPRCYTVPQVRDALQMPRQTFYKLWRSGKLPFLVELLPRVGRAARFRADLVDRYFEGQHGQSRYFGSARRAG